MKAFLISSGPRTITEIGLDEHFSGYKAVIGARLIEEVRITPGRRLFIDESGRSYEGIKAGFGLFGINIVGNGVIFANDVRDDAAAEQFLTEIRETIIWHDVGETPEAMVNFFMWEAEIEEEEFLPIDSYEDFRAAMPKDPYETMGFLMFSDPDHINRFRDEYVATAPYRFAIWHDDAAPFIEEVVEAAQACGLVQIDFNWPWFTNSLAAVNNYKSRMKGWMWVVADKEMQTVERFHDVHEEMTNND